MNLKSIEIDVKQANNNITVAVIKLDAIAELLGSVPLRCCPMRMNNVGEVAGNHYHKSAHEVIVCISGTAEIGYRPYDSKETETHILHSDPSNGIISAVLLPQQVAHAVRIYEPEADHAQLLVFSSGEINKAERVKCVVL